MKHEIQLLAGNGQCRLAHAHPSLGVIDLLLRDHALREERLLPFQRDARIDHIGLTLLDGGPRLRTLNLLSGGKRRRSDGQIILVTFAGICAHAYAIQEPRGRAMRNFFDSKQEFVALDLRFDRLLGCGADAKQGRSVGVMKRRRQSIFDYHVV